MAISLGMTLDAIHNDIVTTNSQTGKPYVMHIAYCILGVEIVKQYLMLFGITNIFTITVMLQTLSSKTYFALMIFFFTQDLFTLL